MSTEEITLKMSMSSIITVFLLVLLPYLVNGFTVGSAPYAYAECSDTSLECSLYGKIDLNNQMAQIISHYRNQGRIETRIAIKQIPHDVPPELTEFTTDNSRTPYIKFPHDVIRYGRNVVELEIAMNTSIDSRTLFKLPLLENITISHVQNLSSHAITEVSNLTTFKLSDVTLKEIPEDMISMCSNLKNITIQNATIESFSSQAFYSLFSVDTLILTKLKVGMFQDGPFAGMINLQNLEITDSGLTVVKKSWLKFLPKLTKLNLEKNELTSIDSNTFGSLSNLKILDLSYNQLSQVSEDAFIGLKRLRVLNLSQNKLTTLPVINHLTRLNIFNISHNQLSEASTKYFESLRKLQHVDLTNNQIGNFTIDNLETNYSLAVNVAFLSKSHYTLLKSSSTIDLPSLFNRSTGLNGYTRKLKETLQGEYGKIFLILIFALCCS